MSRINATMTPPARAIQREQFDQAKRIHGGLWPLLVATLGVRLSRLPIPTVTTVCARAASGDPTVSIGRLYQRETIVDHEFRVPVDDLMKPSLLVGAPGSGKTNLAFSLLIDLWELEPE